MINQSFFFRMPDFIRNSLLEIRTLKISILSLGITVVSLAGAVPIDDLDVGDTVYTNNLFSENELAVVKRIDTARGRIKIQYATGGIDWVSPSDLYTRSGARQEDIKEAVVTTAIIAGALWAIFDPEGFKDAMRGQSTSSSSPESRQKKRTVNGQKSGATKRNSGSVVAISAVPFSPVVKGAWVDEGDPWNKWSETVLRKNLGKPVAIESVRTKSIPFYSTENRNVLLVEAVQTGRIGAYYIIAIAGGKSLVVLDGSGASIHKLNKLLGFSVNSSATAESYLRFFTSAISADKGIYIILDPNVDYLSQQSIKEIGIKPLRTYSEKGKGWKILADVIHGNNVHSAEFLVSRNGNVEMRGDSFKRELAFEYLVFMDGARRLYVSQ